MGDLPSGTVTFLFTDIEGSTRRWQDDPAMSSALTRHDEILRSAVADHTGHWVKHTGDGMLAVFASAQSAVRAAVGAQRAMAEEPWETRPLRVRMGLHSGEAEERGGDYFGPQVNLAARVMSAAHGGQILASASTRTLARVGSIEYVELGVHQLPDVSEPEQLFQVAADGLQREFPPLRLSAETRAKLPSSRTSFVGRDDDIAQLREVLRSRRLVTLTGVGGSGKTRLAIELGRHLVDDFPDGVFFVDLSAVTDEEVIPREVGRQFGIRPGSLGAASSNAREDLLGFLSDQHLLVILDNCEHLLDACADLVDKTLAVCEEVSVLATSREPLAVEGEQVWQVRSLPVPEEGDTTSTAAVDLLVDRVRSIQPDFDAVAAAGALAEIARRLDGVPLALELAAARVPHLGISGVAARLDDRFRLLAGGRRRAQRQQTLQATLDWSHDLLSDAERTVLRRIAVFAGSFALDAVEAVCGQDLGGQEVLDLLSSLVDKSLVVVEADDEILRYRLLETIRLYAEEKLLTAGEAEPTRVRHRDWYLAWLERQPLNDLLNDIATIDRLEIEHDNLRTAMQWSIGAHAWSLASTQLMYMVGLIFFHAHYEELRWWSQAIMDAPDADEESRAVAAVCRGFRSNLDRLTRRGPATGGPLDHVPNPLQTVEESRGRIVAALKVLPDDHPAGFLACVALTTTSAVLVDVDAILRWTAEARRRGERFGVPWTIGWIAGFEGAAHLYRSDAHAALDVVGRALDDPVAREQDNGFLLFHYAIAAYFVDDHAAARRILDQLDVHPRTPDPAWPRIADALSAGALGDLDAMRAFMRDAVDAHRARRWRRRYAGGDVLTGLALVALHEGDYQRASRHLATVAPNWYSPGGFILWHHARDQVREQLDHETRQRCIEEGRAISVEEALDLELSS